MPELVEVPDPPAGATGRIQVDRRGTSADGRPPLVLIGGLTQTITSWSGQIRHLARRREVLSYETRGQGDTELSLTELGFERHVDDFAALLEALRLEPPVDLCGFSFGGRLSLAIVASRPELVRRLVVTGVGTGDGTLRRVIVRGWRAALATGDLEAVTWMSLADTLGHEYLSKHEDMLANIVETVVERNRYEAIRALFEHTDALGPDSAWSAESLAERVRCPALILGGRHDRLAPPEAIADLAQRLGGRSRVFEDSGHTVPIETPEAWRRQVLAFLDED